MKDFLCFNWEGAEETINYQREAEGLLPDYKIEIGGSWDENEVKFLIIELKNYVNTNEKQFEPHVTEEALLAWFKEHTPYFYLFHPALYFNADDRESPFNSYPQGVFYKLSSEVEMKGRYFFELSVLEDDIGWIVESKITFTAVSKGNSQF